MCALLVLMLAGGTVVAHASCTRWTTTASTPVLANGTATSAISVKYTRGTSYSVTVTVTGSARFGNGLQTFTQTVNQNNPINITATDTTAETVTVKQTSSTCTQTKTVQFTNAAPTVATAFSPASIAVNGTSTLSITLNNPNAAAITDVSLSNTYPSGLRNASPLLTGNTCGGTLTASAGGSSWSLSGGTIPAAGGCTISTLVTATSTGTKTNSTGTISSGNAASASSVSASLSVVAVSSTLSTVVASPTSVPADNVTTATVTVTLRDGAGNPVSSKNVSLAGAPSANNTVTTVSGSTNSAGVATFTVRASAAQAVTYTATDSSDSIVLQPTAQVTFTTVQAISKSFSPTSVAVNGTSSMTIVLSNTGNSNLTGQTFTDTYPAGLVNAATPPSSLSGAGCSGSVSGTTGGASLSLSNATIPKNSSCSVTVSVRSSATGSRVNTVTGTAGSASATLTVLPVSATNSTVVASPTSVPANGISIATITVTLRDGAATPGPVAGKVVQLTASSGSSVITAVSGTTSASGVATFTVRNTVSEGPITYTATDATDGITVAATAQVTFTDITAPTVSKSFSPSTIGDFGTSTLTVTLTNPNAAAIGGLAFRDTYPVTGGLSNTTPLVLSNTCGGSSPLTVAGGTVLDLVGGTLPASGSCSLSVQVSADSANGSIVNSTGAVTSINALGGASASATLTNLPIDAAQSTVVASPATVDADGAAVSTITVTLVDGAGDGVQDLTISLTAGSGSSVITAVNALTDANGQAFFTVRNSSAQTVTYTARDTTDGITLPQTASVTFTTPQSSVQSITCSVNCTQPATGATVSWAVTFNRSVTGVSASAFSLATSGITGAFISAVSGSGTSWTVTANVGVGSGTLGLNQSTAGAVSPALTGTFTGEVYTLVTAPTALALYRMDEATWSGAAGQVLDSSGNGYHAQTTNGATTSGASPAPAITTNPGTCRYGVMTGGSVNNGYVTTPLAHVASDFTVAGWIHPTSVASAGSRVIADDANGSSGWYLSVGDDGARHLRFHNRLATPAALDSSYALSNNTWYFIAAVADVVNRTRTIHVFSATGVLLATTSASYTGSFSGTGGGGAVTIGGTAGAYFKGYLDEVQVYPRVLSAAALAALATQTHTCPIVTGPDHFGVSHSGAGVTCTPASVTIAPHNADHSTFSGYTGTVALSTDTGQGDWSVLAGMGTLNNGTVNDGSATYTFAAGDNSSVTLGLSHTTIGNVGIGAADGVVTNLSGSALAAERAAIAFADTGFEFQANGVAGTIGMQIAGKSSATAPGAQTLRLRAVRTSDATGACEAALVGSRSVQFALECVSPAACGSGTLNVTGSGAGVTLPGNGAGSVGSYAAVALAFDAAGYAPFTLNYGDAGSLRVHARYELPLGDGAPSGQYMSGASNTFVSRPFGFAVTLSGNPATTGSGGARFVRAGDGFGGQVRAVAWSAADDTNNDGIVDGVTVGNGNPLDNASLADNATTSNYVPTGALSLGSTLYAPAGGVHPGLGGNPVVTFSGGVASLSGLTYAEAGIIEITAVQGGDYLGIGTVATAGIRGASGPVGRFYPARFAVVAISLMHDNRCASGAFSYLGQPVYFGTAPQLAVTALNAAGGTTANYTTAGFFRLVTTLAGRGYDDAGGHALTLAAAGGVALAGNTGGTGTATLTLSAGSGGDAISYVRALPEAPFAANLTLRVPVSDLTDSDGVCYDATGDGTCDSFERTGITGTTLRYGRLVADNALGSEVSPLALPVYAQYYTGSGFVTHSADACTALNTAALDFGAGTPAAAPAAGVTTVAVGGGTTTATLTSGTLAAGLLDLRLSAPGNGNTGEIDYLLDLDAAGVPWLQFDWDGNGTYTDDPHGRASFGLFAGPKQVIIRREAW